MSKKGGLERDQPRSPWIRPAISYYCKKYVEYHSVTCENSIFSNINSIESNCSIISYSNKNILIVQHVHLLLVALHRPNLVSVESLNDTVSSHMTTRDRSSMEVSYGQFSSTEEDSGDVSTTVA